MGDCTVVRRLALLTVPGSPGQGPKQLTRVPARPSQPGQDTEAPPWGLGVRVQASGASGHRGPSQHP